MYNGKDVTKIKILPVDLLDYYFQRMLNSAVFSMFVFYFLIYCVFMRSLSTLKSTTNKINGTYLGVYSTYHSR